MKAAALTCCLLVAGATANAVNPVSCVVDLLKGLSATVEKEGKMEEGMYEDFVCWGKSIVSQKTDSNSAASSRIDELQAYIADLDSGRVELTSERADLEKEVAGLMSDRESATALRQKENSDFLDAEDEMKKAKTALKSAIDTLGAATKDHKEGVLLSVRASLKGAAANGGMAALLEHQASLKQAVDLGERFLSKSDAMFLRRMLLGEVPKVDWKKLNRKATFKMSYKARSFKIQDVLKKMHQTFSTNLADATSAEKASLDSYNTLTKAKQQQLDAAQGALTKMSSENGAKGMSRQESVDEVKALQDQVTNDEAFIKQTEKALSDKKAAWKVRSATRSSELAAISKAIYILHNDDSRDLFKKSFDSQFLQVAQTSHSQRAQSAAAALVDAAKRSGDTRLMSLAKDLAPFKSVKGAFDPILKAIEKMIALLQSQEEKDLATKQTCESDRMDNTRTVAVKSREIDDQTDKITQLSTHIAECEKKIAELIADRKKANEALKAAQTMRNDENAEWKQTNRDDQKAYVTVKSAQKVIADWYAANKAFVQVGKQPVSGMGAGEAPPPPPATFEADYGGKQGESQGIVAIMEMVAEDIKKDSADAKSDEDSSQKEFDNFKKDSEKKMKELKAEEDAQSASKGKAMQSRTDTERQRRNNKKALDSTLETIKSIDPNCEYYMVNYPMRRDNRQIEIDGLNKAKAILKGGSFDEGPDPNREIKPGDAAFLQRRN
jgi:hypothetical protein